MTLAATPDAGSETLAEVGFEVRLDNFEGPFDLLLSLISKHKLDITEVSLSRVTDEFIAHVKAGAAADGEWDLEQTSSFLVVASTLLDLDSARLALRREHGLAVDRGRIVREAIALVLADLEEHGYDSLIVQRLVEE